MSNIETFTFKAPTVVVLVGPTNCGKSKFASTMQSRLGDDVCTVLSSDEIRQEVLRKDYHKYDPEMMNVSEKAFKLLSAKLQAHGSFPHATPIIVIDTTGLSKDFRQQMVQASHRLGYKACAVAFNYRERTAYFPEFQRVDHRLIRKHLDRLRADALPFLRKEDFDQVIHVRQKTPNFEGYGFVYVSESTGIIQAKHKCDIIGDIHGCYEDLMALLTRLGHTVSDNGIMLNGEPDGLIFVGDLIDKGPDSKQVLKLAVQSMEADPRIQGIWGNHENFVWHYGKGTPGYADSTPDVLAKFDCHRFMSGPEKDGEFIDLLGRYRAMAKLSLTSTNLVITHAPCEEEFIGKGNRSAAKLQNRRTGQPRADQYENVDRYKEALERFYDFLPRQASKNKPLHVFGHVAVQSPLIVGNKVGIDTGAVYGNVLTAVRINVNDKYKQFYSVASVQAKSEPLVRLFETERATNANNFSLDQLEPHDRRRVLAMAHQGVCFVSGTMSPSSSSLESDELESLDEAIKYYQDRGISQLSVQPKWMGSRANIYLYPELEKCFAISRNGYKVRVDLTDEFKRLQPLLEDLKARELILDCELMPWSALGQGLIDETFMVVQKGAQTEIEMLKRYGFEQQLVVLRDTMLAGVSDELFERDNKSVEERELLRKAFIKKYGHAKACTYESFQGFNWIPLGEQSTLIGKYADQLAIHGAQYTPFVAPFAILKMVDADGNVGTARKADAWTAYALLHTDNPSVDVDLQSPESIRRARALHVLTQQTGMEGVVVKPRYHKDGLAPYLKVRNAEYLRLVYGYDYTLPHKRNRLIKQKNTTNKVRTSIKEWELGLKLLDLPKEKLVSDNKEYLALLTALVVEQAGERELDPRL